MKLEIFIDAPFRLGQSIAAIFFMWCGQMYKFIIDKHQLFSKSAICATGTIIGFLIILFVAWWLNDSIDLAGNYYPSAKLLVILTALVGCISLYMQSTLIGKLKINRLFVFYGINSMFILGFHIPLRNICRLVFSKMGLTAQQSAFPIFLLILVFSVPLICLVNKYIPFLVGMRKTKKISKPTNT